ncbi:hypothetical protein BX600DRAFT_514862 [Xylariales sp. PMI_506]|nr:hypothetical protein BX600DRAFT_514862 [Xylariales sp. PMI_506]
MRAAVYYLDNNADAYDKLTAELDAIEPRLPAQWTDVKGLPYLDAVICESFHIDPDIAMIFERMVTEGAICYAIKLIDHNHQWKYYNAWFVYQWDMPMRISRRKRTA